MIVSTRNTLLAGAGFLSIALLGGFAYAGGGSGGHDGHCCKQPKGPQVIVPGVHVSGPKVVVKGPHVSVHQGNLVTNTQTFINTNIVGSGESNIVVSGGGGFAVPQGVGVTAIGALNVEGGEETYTETEEYCEDKISIKSITRPVQAVCIDDKGVPHPASQVDAGERVAAAYRGEVFRCMAGTRMQVTFGVLENGTVSFDRGETFACQKGEALVHQPGGHLVCAPQTPQRSCNERSLLRRHGAGLKLVQSKHQAKTCIPRTRTVTKTRKSQSAGQSMVFDGGVGQGVY